MLNAQSCSGTIQQEGAKGHYAAVPLQWCALLALGVAPLSVRICPDSSVRAPSSVRMGVSSSDFTEPAIVADPNTTLLASSEYFR